MTGGRLKRARPFLDPDDPFCFTYGDGVSDVDIPALIAFHRERRKLVTVTAVQPPGRFGALRFGDDGLAEFVEKPRGDGTWINGGFFVLQPQVMSYIDGDDSIWERAPKLRMIRDRTVADLWGFCGTCYYADECRAGCTWTSFLIFGRAGNNPFCHHRALEHQKLGKRERLVPRGLAPGVPFDYAPFDVVVEDI